MTKVHTRNKSILITLKGVYLTVNYLDTYPLTSLSITDITIGNTKITIYPLFSLEDLEIIATEAIKAIDIQATLGNTKPSSKRCPNCGNAELLLNRTYLEKVCTDCDTHIVWDLAEDQEMLV